MKVDNGTLLCSLEDEKEEMAAAVRLGLVDKFLKPEEVEKRKKDKERHHQEEYFKTIGPADPKQFLGNINVILIY